MGVLNLWKILNSTCEPINLDELKNKTLAIDLSIWIVENSTIKFNTNNTKPHLRALFFRCKCLLEIGCKLIFVREGDVIELKKDTMKKRNQARYGDSNFSQSQQIKSSKTCSSSQSSNPQKDIKKRSRFDHIADECCDLLKSMGVTVIKSPCGEAEKACAYLNLIGRCDGVITDDSDVFLYGAKCVYKNFCMDKKSEIKIEKYSMDKIENDLGYTREHLLVLGLILGCDYDPKGIPGVGKENATKFLAELAELNKTRSLDALELVRSWRKPDYKTNGLKYEDRIRKAILSNDDIIFPNEKIIQEYMSISRLAQILLSQEKYLTIDWKRPNLKDCQIINEQKQAWPYEYTAEKLVPLIVQFENENCINLNERIIKPIKINKIRHRDFNQYYEVAWKKLIAIDKSDTDLSELNEYVTLERPEVLERFFPNLITEYHEMIESKKAFRKSKKSKKSQKENKKQEKDQRKVREDDDSDEDGMTSIMELYENFSVEEATTKNQSITTKLNKNQNLREENLANCEILKVSNISSLPLRSNESTNNYVSDESINNDDDIIVLDDTIDEAFTKLTKSDYKQDQNNLESLLVSFESIKIDKETASNTTTSSKFKSPKAESSSADAYVPFSQRMKTIYNNASIFDK